LSIISNKENQIISNKSSLLFDILIKNIKFEFNKFEKELDNQIENRNYSKLSEDAYNTKKDFDKLFESSNINQKEEDEDKLLSGNDIELKEEELTILNIQLENWDIYYLHLITLEKLISLYPSYFSKILCQDKDFSQILFRSLKHPHIFIKTVVLRLFTKIFSEESKILNMNDISQVNIFINNITIDKTSNYIDNQNVHSNTLQVIFDNLKFIILNKDINLKEDFVNSAIEISSFLVFFLIKLYLKNNEIKENEFEDYSFYAYEFICKLYVQSKQYMAKREYTNKVIRRILVIFENLITYANLKYDMFDIAIKQINQKEKSKKNNEEARIKKGKTLEILLEPVLSLLFRLTTNNLIDEEIKVYADNVKYFKFLLLRCIINLFFVIFLIKIRL